MAEQISSRRRDQLEPGREERLAAGSCHADDPVLERLAQGLERRPHELRQLVQEQDAAMRDARLTPAGPRTAADDGRRRGRVVRSPERRLGDERVARPEEPRDSVDASHLERLHRLRLPLHEDRPRELHVLMVVTVTVIVIAIVLMAVIVHRPSLLPPPAALLMNLASSHCSISSASKRRTFVPRR
jgi:hypothetical protein